MGLEGDRLGYDAGEGAGALISRSFGICQSSRNNDNPEVKELSEETFLFHGIAPSLVAVVEYDSSASVIDLTPTSSIKTKAQTPSPDLQSSNEGPRSTLASY